MFLSNKKFVGPITTHVSGSPRPEHIEDTNGADNYSLQTITEQDVAADKMGSRGTVRKSGLKSILRDLVFQMV